MTRSLTLLGTSLLVVLATACGDDGANNKGNCGDGHVTGSEGCDDGNQLNGDGCSATCQDEGLCGNGTFDVSSEECDDGNTMDGDGCSSMCDREGTCGNGAVEAGETCDDANTMSMDGCNGACAVEVGFMCEGMPSVCSPTTGGGTCTGPGIIALTAMGTDLTGTGDGDTTNATNGLPEALCDGSLAGAGKDQIWKFTTTDTRDVIILLAGDFDGGIRMMTAPCDVATQVIDQVGDDGCSDYYSDGDPQEILGYVNLPAGTYYIAVDGYEAQDAGMYTVSVLATLPGCGDGLVGDIEFCDDGNAIDSDGCTHCTIDDGFNCDQSEPSVCQAEGCGDGIIQDLDGEECDDDNTDPLDGCDADCLIEDGFTCMNEPSVCVEAGCNNGIVESGEECDDGNLIDGDRCSTVCVLEFDATEGTEPTNDTTPVALTPGSHIVRATIEDGDVDLYTFTLTATSRVDIETYATINGELADYDDGYGDNPLFDCLLEEDDTLVDLFTGTGTGGTLLASDDDDGDFFCSYLGVNASNNLGALPAGTYTIRVQPSTLAISIPAGWVYMLDLKITPMGTAPVAPAAGDLKINEFLARDGGTTNGGVDSNCDGSLTDSNDEFIELVNVSNKTLDLTDVTYSDALGVKFTFSAQTTGSLTLAPNKAVVIWGGGTPQCPGVTNFFTNGTRHTLSLNDGGDSITIKTGGANPVTIATTTYAIGTLGKSLNASPDITGTAYALHDLVTGAVGNFSPGKKVDGAAF